jgi:integrase
MRQTLTDKFVAGVRRETQTVFFDTHVRGLVLRVGPSRKTWYFTYRRRGSPTQWLKLGPYPELTLADARTRAREERYTLEVLGDDPVTAAREAIAAAEHAETAAPPPAAPLFTFGDFIPVFVQFQKGRKKTWRDDAVMIERHLREPWGDLELASLNRTHVHQVLDTALGRGLSVGVNRLQALISRIFTVALDRNLIQSHPAARVIKRARETARERVLSDDEIRTLWAKLEQTPTPASEVIRLRLLLGQRGQETIGMRWSEIDLEAATWTLPGTRTKNRRPHLVALPARAHAIVTACRERVAAGEARVFPGLTTNHVDYRALSEIPITGEYDWRDLRRTVATRLGELGFSETIIGRVLNHARATVTGKHYNQHAYVAEIRQALAAWDAELGHILAKTPRTTARVVPIQRGT